MALLEGTASNLNLYVYFKSNVVIVRRPVVGFDDKGYYIGVVENIPDKVFLNG